MDAIIAAPPLPSVVMLGILALIMLGTVIFVMLDIVVFVTLDIVVFVMLDIVVFVMLDTVILAVGGSVTFGSQVISLFRVCIKTKKKHLTLGYVISNLLIRQLNLHQDTLQGWGAHTNSILTD